jgi:F-type H+-transporting ATPase subunit delta
VAQLNNRYASALFKLASERGLINEYLEQAVFLRDTLNETECNKVLTHPKITSAQKRDFFEKSFGGSIHGDLIGLLNLAVEKNREKFVVPALITFIDMANAALRRTKALVVSAVPLKNEQISNITAVLARKTNKQVEVEVKIDPSVIGGLFIQVDGYFMDRTVKTRLEDMKVNLQTV